MTESEAELKSLLKKVKEESGKAGLKFNIPKTKAMASGLITSWQTDGEKGKPTDLHFMANKWGKSGNSDIWGESRNGNSFIFLGSKITVDGDCSHKNKRHLLLGREVMTSLERILKSRDITLPTKVCLVTAFQWSCMDVRAGP